MINLNCRYKLPKYEIIAQNKKKFTFKDIIAIILKEATI